MAPRSRNQTPEEKAADRELQDYVLYGILAALLVLYVVRYLHRRASRLDRSKVKAEYDYIVVGSGASGCVVAHRLITQDENATVLLLEAGADDMDHDKILYGSYCYDLIGSVIDWAHKSPAEPLLENRELKHSSGKVLGGSSAIDEGIYQRPPACELDGLAKLGVIGWSYEDCLPYFTKSETSGIEEKTAHHGTTGPLMTGFAPVRGPIGKLAADAAAEMGVCKNYDSNNAAAKSGTGVSPTQVACNKKGYRQSAATAFLRPLLKDRSTSSRLTVRTSAVVTAITWHDAAKGEGERKASGVEWANASSLGTKRQVKCRKRVVLCGGAIETPAILLKSGVGSDKSSTLKNAAVGKNLRDNLKVPLIYQTKQGTSFDNCNIHSVMQWVAYKFSGSGTILSYPCDTLLLLNKATHGFKNSWGDETKPADMLAAAKGKSADVFVSVLSKGGFRRLEWAARGISDHVGRFNEAMTFNVTVAQRYVPRVLPPEGNGSVKLDDNGNVVASVCCVRSDEDLTQLAPAIRFCRRLANTDPLRLVLTSREAVDVTLLSAIDPLEAVNVMYGPKAIRRRKTNNMPPDDLVELKAIQSDIDSDMYLLKYVKKHGQPLGSPCGSCSLAPLKGLD
eukprot:gene6072-9328_t